MSAAAAAHRKVLERTNGGNYFADCTCGWQGGVHRDRAAATRAHAAHLNGGERVEPVRPVLLICPPTTERTR